MKIKEFANDGFAVWLDGQSEIDLHINEWLVSNKKNYIDIGARIHKAEQVKAISFFIPYSVTKDEIEDLSIKFRDERVVRGVFNAVCEILQSSTSEILTIQYNGRTENIVALSLLDTTVQSIEEGTIISFHFGRVTSSLTSNYAYIRFRLPHQSLNMLFRNKTRPFLSLVNSPVVKRKYNYMLRINEVRALPLEVRRQIENKEPIKKVIVSLHVNEKYDVADSECYKIRQLENNLYASYVPDQYDCRDIIAYQWLMENRDNFYFNITIIREAISKRSLCVYALIVITLSALGSALWTQAESLLKYIGLLSS